MKIDLCDMGKKKNSYNIHLAPRKMENTCKFLNETRVRYRRVLNFSQRGV